MEQHAVPQDITGFEFKLVGDMTLKQFGELAFGAIIAYIFFASSFPGLIKFPLAVFFLILGLALAFLPVEERPLDVWLSNFFRSIYSPTVYVWEKNQTTIAFEQSSPVQIQPIITSVADGPVSTWPYQKESSPSVTIAPPSSPSQTVPQSPVPATPPVVPSVSPLPIAPAENQSPDPSQAVKPLSVEQLASIREQKLQEISKAVAPTFISNTRELTNQPTMTIDQLASLRVDQAKFSAGQQDPFGQNVKVAQKPVVRDQSFVLTDVPNVINGLVLNEKGVPLDNAILVIKDKSGNSIRALKTNPVGQFIASTPLPNDQYFLEFERRSYAFDTLEVNLNGQVLQPIKVIGKQSQYL